MASVRIGLRDGWRPAVKLAIGAGILDFVYCAISMWASTAVIGALQSLEGGNPLITLGIQIVVIIAMIGFGVFQIIERPVKPEMMEKQLTKVANAETSTSHGPLFVGAALAVANLANPTFIPAVMAMTTFVQKMALFEPTLTNALAFSVGFGSGNALWLVTLVKLVLSLRNKMTPKFIHRIQQASGVTLVGFGAYTAFRILSATPWSDISKMLARI